VGSPYSSTTILDGIIRKKNVRLEIRDEIERKTMRERKWRQIDERKAMRKRNRKREREKGRKRDRKRWTRYRQERDREKEKERKRKRETLW